jgi:Putative amidoligase enzyme
VSPVFLGFPGSTWRRGVEETWRYLKKNYNVLGSDTCATHIHIGLESGFDLVHLKRIAQAVIHFETAFEGLVPSCRRNNPYVKSNWLDAPGLAQKNKSRPESIAAIGATSNPEQLLALLHPVARLHVHKIRSFSWNFFSWYSKGSIEFRKPPASVTSVEALSWAELAMSFVQASIGCESSKTLQDIPPSAGGLLWFLEKFGTEQGVNEPARLQRLWRGTHPELFIEPKPQPQDNTDLKPEQVFELYDSLTIMATADKARVMALIRNARGRYWQQ